MEIGSLIIIFAAIIPIAKGSCFSGTLLAETYTQSKFIFPSKNENCTFDIKPSPVYSSGLYYLEISWEESYFNVKGDMPFCKDDYVEVYLTRDYKSIGRFCSRNARYPFTMYSRDGYAKIGYRINGYEKGIAFRVHYKLQSNENSNLGGSPYSSGCYNSYSSDATGKIYSTGWPSGYQSSSIPCTYQISKSSRYAGIYLVFMDISLYSFGLPNDCMEVSGYNNSHTGFVSFSIKLCYTSYIGGFFVYSDVLNIKFKRTYGRGYSSSYRGFVAGYMMFGKDGHSYSTATPTTGKDGHSYSTATPASGILSKDGHSYSTATPTTEKATMLVPANEVDWKSGTSDHQSLNTVAILLGTLIPTMIILTITLSVFILVQKRRNSRNSAGALLQDQDTETEATQNTLPATSYMLCPNNALSNPENAYRVPSSITECYPNWSQPMAQPTVNSSSFCQSTTTPSVSQQLTFMVSPSSSSNPVGAFPPSTMSGNQGR